MAVVPDLFQFGAVHQVFEHWEIDDETISLVEFFSIWMSRFCENLSAIFFWQKMQQDSEIRMLFHLVFCPVIVMRNACSFLNQSKLTIQNRCWHGTKLQSENELMLKLLTNQIS